VASLEYRFLLYSVVQCLCALFKEQLMLLLDRPI